MDADEAIDLVIGWADGSVSHVDCERLQEAAKVARSEVVRLRDTQMAYMICRGILDEIDPDKSKRAVL